MSDILQLLAGTAMPANPFILIGMHAANLVIAWAYMLIGACFMRAWVNDRHLHLTPEISLNIGTFVLLCAGTHFGMIGAMYAGWMLIALGVKVITALFSAHTAYWFWKVKIGA